MIKNLTVVGFNDFSVGIIDQHICTAHIGPVGSGVRCGQVTQLPLLNVVLIGLALTLVTVGVGAAISVQQVAKRWSGFNTLAKRAPYFSSLLIGLVGVYMGVHGFMGIMR